MLAVKQCAVRGREKMTNKQARELVGKVWRDVIKESLVVSTA